MRGSASPGRSLWTNQHRTLRNSHDEVYVLRDVFEEAVGEVAGRWGGSMKKRKARFRTGSSNLPSRNERAALTHFDPTPPIPLLQEKISKSDSARRSSERWNGGDATREDHHSRRKVSMIRVRKSFLLPLPEYSVVSIVLGHEPRCVVSDGDWRRKGGGR